jgi:hypothetical protein
MSEQTHSEKLRELGMKTVQHLLFETNMDPFRGKPTYERPEPQIQYDSKVAFVPDFSQNTRDLLTFSINASFVILICFMFFGISTKKGIFRTIGLMAVVWVTRAIVLSVLDSQQLVSLTSDFVGERCVGISLTSRNNPDYKKCLDSIQLLNQPMSTIQTDLRNEHLLDFMPSFVDTLMMKIITTLVILGCIFGLVSFVTRTPPSAPQVITVHQPPSPVKYVYLNERDDEEEE